MLVDDKYFRINAEFFVDISIHDQSEAEAPKDLADRETIKWTLRKKKDGIEVTGGNGICTYRGTTGTSPTLYTYRAVIAKAVAARMVANEFYWLEFEDISEDDPIGLGKRIEKQALYY